MNKLELITKKGAAMPTLQAASDHYMIGFLVSGDRKWFSYERIGIAHSGDVGICKSEVYHRNCGRFDSRIHDALIYMENNLGNTCLSISQISWKAGFSNPNYMSTVFSKKFMCSPSSYRKNSGNAPEGDI